MRTILVMLMLSAGVAMAQKSTKILPYTSSYLFSSQKVVYVKRGFTHAYCYLENSVGDTKGGVVFRGEEIDSVYSILKKCLVSFKAWNSGGLEPGISVIDDSELFVFDDSDNVETRRSQFRIRFNTYDGVKTMIVRIDDYITALNYNEAVAFTRLFSPATINE
jgi:hypothetical protein